MKTAGYGKSNMLLLFLERVHMGEVSGFERPVKLRGWGKDPNIGSPISSMHPDKQLERQGCCLKG